MEAVEVKTNEVDITFEAWDDPKEVNVNPITMSTDSSIDVFDTGATHHVFNNRALFITFLKTAAIPVKMADGTRGGVITGVGSVNVESGERGGDHMLLKTVYLCESLQHSLISGISIYEDGMTFETDEIGLKITSPHGKKIRADCQGR